MESSASGLTPISWRAKRAQSRTASVSTSAPDSLAISMDIWATPGDRLSSAGAATGMPAGVSPAAGYGADPLSFLLLLGGGPALVRVNHVPDPPGPHHGRAGQQREMH